MSCGVQAAIGILVSNVALTAQVPSSSIIAGPFVAGMSVPAISVKNVVEIPIGREFSTAPRQLVRTLVQITVRSNDYGEAHDIGELVRKAMRGRSGVINGVQVSSIVKDALHADMRDGDDHFIRAQDFKVFHYQYNE